MAQHAHIVGWGMSLPKQIMTNDDWAQRVDTSDEWIRTRTGVVERYIVDEGETTLTMSLEAAWEALEVARLSPANLDMVIVATTTPEHIFPSTACLVQDGLGAMNAAAFDLSAGCSGFIYAMKMAADSIMAGTCRHVLVIGAETMSRILDWTDRSTCVLFGDGAGAVVVSASEVAGGVLSSALGSDGSGGDYLIVPAGGSKQPASQQTVEQRLHYLRMNGREVYRFATRIMEKATRLTCQKAGIPLEHIELVVPHQANTRIIQSAARSLKLPEERFVVNLDRYGNTSAASVPIALYEAVKAGRIQRGDHVALVGFGAGLTWGAMVIEWAVPLPIVPVPWWQHLLHRLYYVWARLRSGAVRLRRRLDSWRYNSNGNSNTGNDSPSSTTAGTPIQQPAEEQVESETQTVESETPAEDSDKPE